MSFWTSDDTLALEQLLARIPHPMPYQVFSALSKKMTTTAMELVILRWNLAAVEVLLMKRPVDDPHWPGYWHYPGTIIRPSDESLEVAMQRLLSTEVGHASYEFIGLNLEHFSRGTVVQLMHLGAIIGEPMKGGFFPVKDLPQPFIQEQLPGLNMVVKVFEALTA
jgi:hypothetical protein